MPRSLYPEAGERLSESDSTNRVWYPVVRFAMRVLVTGGAGWIGSDSAACLLQQWED